MLEFTLKTEYIELNKLLKIMNLAESGGHANLLIDEGYIMVNGELESRRRRKLRKGDQIEAADQIIKVL